jgi:transposase
VLSGGEAHDSGFAIPLLAEVDIKGACVLADKAYDTNDILEYISHAEAISNIPPKSNRLVQRQYDEHIYKERHLIECFFERLKNFRRVSTRYDKGATSFLAFVYIAAICILVK